MPLSAGVRLGPYEILALIGAGGMGEVYSAHDIRLGRTVAVKVLKPRSAGDSAVRRRFEQEARAASVLQHPHICSVFDVGSQDDIDFVVMEHIAGETLERRLVRGRLPLSQALRYAIQIADALARAHAAGIVHRDLKPANIMLAGADAKLLDFGLARLRAAPVTVAAASLADARDDSLVETREPLLTERGTIAGTLAYMAPEQLEGDEVDGRADLFAFGVVMYEMFTGRRPFAAPSAAGLVSAILSSDPPPVSSVEPLASSALDRVVNLCFAKNPCQRWQSAADLKTELSWIADDLAAPKREPPRSRALPVTAALVGLAAAAALVAGLAMNRGRGSDPTATHLTVAASAGIAPLTSQSTVAISDDGQMVAFVGDVHGRSTIFLRRLDRDDAVAVEGTAGAVAPFFSPDSRWLGMFQEGKLRRVPVDGGTPQTIADAPTGRGAVWRSDDTIFYTPMQYGGIFQVPAGGGTPRAVTALDRAAGENSHRFPALADSGRVLLFTVRTGGGFDDAQVVAVRLSSGERRTLVRGGLFGRSLPGSRLAYGKGTTLMAVALDAARLETSGSAVPVLEGVRYNGTGGISDFAVSGTGTLVYVPAALELGAAELVRFGRDGSAEAIAAERMPFREISVSPDGRFALVTADRDGSTELWLVDLARGTERPLARDSRNETPFWAPAGARVFFSSNRRGPTRVYAMNLDGSSEPEPVTQRGDDWQFVTSVAPDGRSLLYGEVKADTGWDIWLQPLPGNSRARRLLSTASHERYARLSPDGRALAFVSDESGRNEVYVVAFPERGARVQLSTAGGSQPVWSRSGHELFYRIDDALMAVPIDTKAPSISAGASVLLFHAPFKTVAVHALGYDVLPGDRAFVGIRAPGAEHARVNVVLNWNAEVTGKVAPSR